MSDEKLRELAVEFIAKLDKENHGQWWSDDAEELEKAFAGFYKFVAERH